MSYDNPNPIKDYHMAFAREVVKLAREHGVGDVKMTFRRSSSKILNTEDKWDSNEVNLQWHEGRHGSTASLDMVMTARASAIVTECPHEFEESYKAAFHTEYKCKHCGKHKRV